MGLKGKWLGNLKKYNVTDEDFNICAKELIARFGKEPTDFDVFWSIFNNLLLKWDKDFQKLQQIYYDMGVFLYEEGNDGVTCLQQAKKMQLLSYKSGNLNNFIVKVKISAIIDEATCEVCKQLHGQTFTVDEALKTMPIPCKGMVDIHGKRTHCRCVYIPITKYDQ